MSAPVDAVTPSALRALDLSLLRHRVAAANVAQANQPGFEALRVGTGVRSVAEAEAGLQRSGPVRLDHEVGEMLAASMAYQTLADALSRHLAMARLAISTRS